ncbi:hypothetical protein J2S22_000354 [Rhodoplanes tepidamans]|uniref:hypothetical protein n=1 Tax=Rhodoplanes sp. TEM TaxID=3025489 RepID=UPI0023504A94|nr:hypothetical protein [Rhodoplanes sp. TEM]MDQ0353448.1 hypothetical protein [Rhodoplanes tepidamans]
MRLVTDTYDAPWKLAAQGEPDVHALAKPQARTAVSTARIASTCFHLTKEAVPTGRSAADWVAA